jgi:cytochrome oxidase Cu insertion factor (SCO1/SenC/PrrC family)
MQRLDRTIVLVFAPLMLAFAAAGPVQAQGSADRPVQATIVDVGRPAPDFSLPASDGKIYRLADLQGKKRLVLVIFRGLW